MSDQRSVGTAVAPGVAQRDAAAGPVPAAPRQAAPARFLAAPGKRKWLPLVAVALIAAGVLAYFAWQYFRPAKLPEGFARSNGRIEATEVDIATKLAERIKDELVDEGDFVSAGQVIAHMSTEVLEAQLAEAKAKLGVAQSAVEICAEHASPAPEREGRERSRRGAARGRP